jgi:hypothetical protein
MNWIELTPNTIPPFDTTVVTREIYRGKNHYTVSTLTSYIVRSDGYGYVWSADDADNVTHYAILDFPLEEFVK